MLRSVPRTMLIALSLLLSPGLANAREPVEVTRFHQADAARSGTVRIIAEEGADAESLEFRTFADAVASALTRAGFTPVADSTATYTARLGYDREVNRPADQRRSPVSVGVGGATGSYGGGLGVGIGINLSGKPKAVIATRLRVQLRNTADGSAFWEGRAETAAKENRQEAQTGNAAAKLAEALFRDYPGPSGETIRVK